MSPGAFSYQDGEAEQIARATVGGGTIIVRDNPDMDLSGLNRDTAQAITTDTLKDMLVKVDPLFGYMDILLSTPPAAVSYTMAHPIDALGLAQNAIENGIREGANGAEKILGKIQNVLGFKGPNAAPAKPDTGGTTQ